MHRYVGAGLVAYMAKRNSSHFVLFITPWMSVISLGPARRIESLLGHGGPKGSSSTRSDVPGGDLLMLAGTAVVSFRKFPALSPLGGCYPHIALERALECGLGLI